ncbi:MAG: hypothetical protein ACOX2O_02975 [Bdellovibrionota bacterium]
MEITCKSCGKSFSIKDSGVSMREECPHCGADIHACIYCKFYSESAYNKCREPQAERVVDKSRNNYCDYFEFSNDSDTIGLGSKINKADYLKQLDSLFK